MTETLHAIIDRLQVIDDERISSRLRAGDRVKGYWGEARQSTTAMASRANVEYFRDCPNRPA